VSTSTVDRPAVQVERITVKRATALIIAASERQGLPFPYGIRQNGHPSDMLCIDFESIAALNAWTGFFGIQTPKPRFNEKLQHFFVAEYNVAWQGWSVVLGAHDEPLATEPELDAETAALIDEVTAEPGRNAPTGDVANRATAAALTAEVTAEPAKVKPALRDIIRFLVGTFGFRWEQQTSTRKAQIAKAIRDSGQALGQWQAIAEPLMGIGVRGDVLTVDPELDPEAREYWPTSLDEATVAMPCATVPVGVELIEIEGRRVHAPDDAYLIDRYGMEGDADAAGQDVTS